uniref:Ig-like domain-containing protein n=1 Tax=Sparus aurata TaxID=8175 RepID=A0A671XYJ7_SPAAU
MCSLIFLLANQKESHLSKDGFVSANLGDSVTMQCFYRDDAVIFYWYQQTLGQKPRLLSTYYKHDKSGVFQKEFNNNSRFALDTGNGKNHLTISDLHVSDSATYYCTGCYAYDFEFVEGITVSVKGSGLNIPASVHQSASEIIQPGGSVTLNCTVHTGTCDGEHSVYWFKHSQESHPGLIYTHGGRNDQCERKDNTQTHTCVYNLSMKSLNRSHAGTYYCAVASCGHILFGNGTKLDFEDLPVLVYFLTGMSAFSTTLCAFMAFLVCMTNRRHSCLSTTDEGYQNEDDDYENVSRENRVNRRRRKTANTWSECVYFSVKQ